MSRWQIFSIVFGAVVGITFLLIMAFSKGMLKKADREIPVVESQEQIGFEEYRGPITEEGKEAYKVAKYVTVEKVMRTTTEYADGQSETSYDTYLIADFTIGSKEAYAQDYTECLKEPEFDENMVFQVDFWEAFELSNEGQNAWELYEDMLLENGFDASLDRVDFDFEAYELTQQERYIFEEHSSVIDYLLYGEEYEVILEQKAYYLVAESDGDVVIPECFNAEVKLLCNGKTVTKNLFIQVTINDWKEDVDGMD